MNQLIMPLLGVFLSSSFLIQETEFGDFDAPKVFNQRLPLAASKPLPPPPIKINKAAAGVKISAQSALVVDNLSGKILFSKKPNQIVPIASLTKLMTAILLQELILDWDKSVIFNDQDFTGGNKPRFETGESLPARQLFQVALIGSDNDAVAALVRSTGLTSEEFVEKMNQRAKKMGLVNTKFSDPTGLNPENRSTASELIKLVKISLKYPAITEATTRKSYKLITSKKEYLIYNTDQLLDSFLNVKPYKIIGGKTGFIEESGYNLALSVKKNRIQITAVVLGSKTNRDRFQEIKGMVSWAFDNWQWPVVSSAGL